MAKYLIEKKENKYYRHTENTNGECESEEHKGFNNSSKGYNQKNMLQFLMNSYINNNDEIIYHDSAKGLIPILIEQIEKSKKQAQKKIKRIDEIKPDLEKLLT